MLWASLFQETVMERCTTYCLAKRFRFGELKQALEKNYRCTVYRDAIHIERGGHIFIFEYGVIVSWGIEHNEEMRLRHELAAYCIDPHAEPMTDNFSYELAATQDRIYQDQISITGGSPLQLLAVSHGLAQSIKLAELEVYAEHTIEETSHIPRNMAKTGRLDLGRKEISRMRGRLFLVESDINLHYALLDTPEFFWEYPEVEALYTMTSRYLDVQPRIEVLNRKLTIIHEMFDMLADEQKHKHSSILEWIIIWLIVIEILIFIFHDLLKWL